MAVGAHVDSHASLRSVDDDGNCHELRTTRAPDGCAARLAHGSRMAAADARVTRAR
jgi:hypothetical protein